MAAALVSVNKTSPEAPSKGRLNYYDYQAQRYMPELDGVRAIAVSLAITAHLHERIWNFVSGFVGVTIFFVLSGYLITRLGLQEETRKGRLNVTSFYVRRIFRILPLYYFVLAVYIFLILGTHLWATKVVPFRIALPYYLSFFQEVPSWMFGSAFASALPFYQSWSMGIEEKFYLFWPLLVAGIPRTRQNTRFAVAILGALICLIQGVLSEARETYHLESYGFILLGVSLALLLSRPRLYQLFGQMAKLTTPLALLVMIMTQLSLRPQAHLRGFSVLYALAVTLIIGSLVTCKGVGTRILSTPALVFMGRVSYGIYLVHILCLNALEQVIKPGSVTGQGLFIYIGTLGLSTGVAYILHRAIEKPMIQVGRRISDKPKPSPLELEVPVAG